MITRVAMIEFPILAVRSGVAVGPDSGDPSLATVCPMRSKTIRWNPEMPQLTPIWDWEIDRSKVLRDINALC